MVNSLINKIKNLEEEQALYRSKLAELQQRSDIHYTLNEILQISLMPLSLEEILDRILLLILDVEWLALNRKGSIFLKEQDNNHLDLMVEYNLGPILQKKCKKVQLGTCLCGKAAKEEKLVFKSCVDDDHHHRPDGMTPHGHYCVPIKGREGLLGVLNLYVKHEHQSTTVEQEFLQAATHVIAGIVERKKLEDKLRNQSHRDELTGLPNRRSLYETLSHSISKATRYEEGLAVFFIDMNKFKIINDNYGHKVGDQLLTEASKRMAQCLRSSDVLARIGGDEFIVLLDRVSTKVEIERVAKRLLRAMEKPIKIENTIIYTGISLGTGLFPQDADNADDLIRVADKLMYENKRSKLDIKLVNH